MGFCLFSSLTTGRFVNTDIYRSTCCFDFVDFVDKFLVWLS